MGYFGVGLGVYVSGPGKEDVELFNREWDYKFDEWRDVCENWKYDLIDAQKIGYTHVNVSYSKSNVTTGQLKIKLKGQSTYIDTNTLDEYDEFELDETYAIEDIDVLKFKLARHPNRVPDDDSD